jgi:outer membrane protein TolC
MSRRIRLTKAAIGLAAVLGLAQECRAAHRQAKPPRSSGPPSPGSVSPDRKAKAASEAGIPLSLTDAVSLALRDNRTIRGAYIDRITQKFSLRVAEDGFMPHLGLSGGAARQTIAGITTTSLDVSPGVTALLPTGATVNFSWADHASEGAGIRTRSTGGILSITQPLLRGGGVDVNLAPIRSARLGEEANRLRLKAIVSETIGQVIYAYRDLLRAQKAMTLAQAAVRRAEEILDINRALIDAGRMPAVEIVQSEADLENQRLGVLGATRSLDGARLKLLDLLALDLGTPILATESTEPAQVATQLPHLMEVAFAQRPDYLGQLLVLEQSKLGLVVAENARLWDLSLFASRTVGRTTIAGPQGSVTGQSDTTVGLAFNAPLNDLQREQPFVQATASRQSAELQLETIRRGIELQIRSLASDIAIRWSQLEGARRARDLAARALEIEREKLKAGRSASYQVRALEAYLRSADVQLLDAVIGYLNTLTLLDLQLGTTLDTWHVALRD